MMRMRYLLKITLKLLNNFRRISVKAVQLLLPKLVTIFFSLLKSVKNFPVFLLVCGEASTISCYSRSLIILFCIRAQVIMLCMLVL